MRTVFGVYRNADMTEGRGPFVLVHLFSDGVTAREYVSRQRGVMGRPGLRDHEEARRIRVQRGFPNDKFHGPCAGWFCTDCWPFGGDWRVNEMPVYDTLMGLLQAKG